MLKALPGGPRLAPRAVPEVREYRRLVFVTFVLFLVIAAFSRLLPRAWRPLRTASPNREESILAEARRAAETVVTFAFTR